MPNGLKCLTIEGMIKINNELKLKISTGRLADRVIVVGRANDGAAN